MARIQEGTITPNGYFADVYQGKQEGDVIYLAVALFASYGRVGISYDSAVDALADLDATIKAREDCKDREAVPSTDNLFDSISKEDEVERTDMHFDLYDIEQRYDELKADYDSLEEEMEARCEGEIDELNVEIQNLEDKVWEFEDVQPTVDELEREVEDLKETILDLEGELSDTEVALVDADERLADLEYKVEQRTNPYPGN